MKFTELPLHEDLMRGIEAAGFVDCTPVQAEAFAHAFQGRGLYVQSQTGTGKTAAFLITIFQRLLLDPAKKGKKALVVVPTRELAVQVEEEARKLGKFLTFNMASFYGGVGYGAQEAELRKGVDLIVGTPGRLLDFQKQGKLLLRDVGFLVIDEADRMFDMGFLPDLREMLRYLPPREERQTMLFSATLNVRVKNLAWDYMEDPVEIVIEPEHVTVNEIEQVLYHVGSDEKMRLLVGLLRKEDPSSAIIFCNMKRMVEEVAKRLRINGIECEFIIGDLPQQQRLRIIEGMKSGKHEILVATDVAARGLDINDLAMVINYDIPIEPENYVHRIGRTARAGKSGKAVTLACEKYVYGLPAIEKYIERKIPVGELSDELFAEDKSAGMRIRIDRYEAQERGRRDGPGRGRPDRGRPGDRGRPERGRAEGTRRGGVRSRPERAAEGRSSIQDAISALAGSDRIRAGAGSAEGLDGGKAHKGQALKEESRARSRQGQKDAQRSRPANPPRQSEGRAGDPYAETMEQRMARYKEKYGQGVTEAKGKGPAKDQDRGRGSEKGKAARPIGQTPKVHGRQGVKQGGAKPQGRRSTAVAPEATAKGGFLSRILGLFKKRKDGE